MLLLLLHKEAKTERQRIKGYTNIQMQSINIGVSGKRKIAIIHGGFFFLI